MKRVAEEVVSTAQNTWGCTWLPLNTFCAFLGINNFLPSYREEDCIFERQFIAWLNDHDHFLEQSAIDQFHLLSAYLYLKKSAINDGNLRRWIIPALLLAWDYLEDFGTGEEELVILAITDICPMILGDYLKSSQRKRKFRRIWNEHTRWLRDMKHQLLKRLGYRLYFTDDEIEAVYAILHPLSAHLRTRRSKEALEVSKNEFLPITGLWSDVPGSSTEGTPQVVDIFNAPIPSGPTSLDSTYLLESNLAFNIFDDEIGCE